MSIDPKDLRAGQRIDLVTDDGARIENLLVWRGDRGHLAVRPLGFVVNLLDRSGLMAPGITVTAIRSQPDPELWLDATGVCWHWQDDMRRWEDQGGCHWELDRVSLLLRRGPLRRLTPGEPVADGDAL